MINGENKELKIGDEVFYLYAKRENINRNLDDVKLIPDEAEITRFTLMHGRIEGFTIDRNGKELVLFENSIVPFIMNMFGNNYSDKRQSYDRYFYASPKTVWFDKENALAGLKSVIEYSKSRMKELLDKFYDSGYEDSIKYILRQENYGKFSDETKSESKNKPTYIFNDSYITKENSEDE